MNRDILLNGEWELRDDILSLDDRQATRLSQLDEGWIVTPVPGDIHQGLIAANRIKEPLLGLNSFDCEWTETRSWWFRRRFHVDEDWQAADRIELEMNGLDSNAEIFLNGLHVGSHRSAFRPFIADIHPWLQPGENVLLVRLTAGVETVSELDGEAPDGTRTLTEANNGRPGRGDPRRALVRKPQYSFGWDWSPRVATTAIAGDVRIRLLKRACIRHVNLRSFSTGDDRVRVQAVITVDQFHYYQTANGQVRVTLTDASGQPHTGECSALLRSGYTYLELNISIDHPHWWWPNGLGDPYLYRAQVELSVEDKPVHSTTFDYGIRLIELECNGDLFAFKVNGQRVFCKGANWIPADTIYARTDDARYDDLIRQARDANFNMLRVWGGGWYERDAFYQACDRYGIMLWHDFMFACAPYPDHLDWFREEVRKEADYQTQRLQSHACLTLWCGNNENNWFFVTAWKEQTRKGAYLYNYLLPSIVQRNCPEIPYWNGSPYGGDHPNSSEVGDHHHWHENMMNPDMNVRISPEAYDHCKSRFVSEFGYIGAVVRESLLTSENRT